MTTTTDIKLATQVYQVFIKATPEQIWDAITKPEFTAKYFYGGRLETTLEPGTPYNFRLGEQIGVEGEVLESDPPRKLVHTWHALYDESLVPEEPSRVQWEIEPQEGGFSKLTVVHDQLEGAPKTAANVSGAGWMMVLSGLKTVLETGRSLQD